MVRSSQTETVGHALRSRHDNITTGREPPAASYPPRAAYDGTAVRAAMGLRNDARSFPFVESNCPVVCSWEQAACCWPLAARCGS
jgi:hypothetical protein